MKKIILLSVLAAALPAFADDAPNVQSGTVTATATATVNGKPVEVIKSGEGTLVISGSAAVAEPVVAPAAKATPATGYELRGFFGSGEKLEVSVRVPGSTESKWLKVGKKSGGLLIEKADSRAGTAVLLADGRRLALKLTGESAPAVAEEPKVAEVSDAEKLRRARHERFRAMRENSTPEQQAEFGRVMREKFDALRKEHPELMDPANRENPELRAKMGEAFRANLREAAEAAAKLPGKDGKISPVPEDFNQLLVEEGKDMESRGAEFRGRRSRDNGGNNAPAPTPAASGDSPAGK